MACGARDGRQGGPSAPLLAFGQFTPRGYLEQDDACGQILTKGKRGFACL